MDNVESGCANRAGSEPVAEEQRHPALKLQERQADSLRNQRRVAGQCVGEKTWEKLT